MDVMRGCISITGRARTIGLCCALLAGACELGPFASEDTPEDHRFLIDLRNATDTPVTLGIVGEVNGFVVQGISVITIQRGAEPGQDLVFEARIEPTFQTTACRYTPPSDVSPRRRVSWDGGGLQCLNWE